MINGKVLFATSDSSLFQAVDAATGKPIYQQDTKAYVFSSPAVAADVAYTGVLNGTLEARDVNSGALLWDFQTELSRANRNWILTPDRKFNTAMLYFSIWREAPVVSTDQQFAIGAFFSSPIVVDGVVYAGSTDGFLYALD